MNREKIKEDILFIMCLLVFVVIYLAVTTDVKIEKLNEYEVFPIHVKTVEEIKYDEPDYIPMITVDRHGDFVIEDVRYEITEKEFKEFVRVVEAEVTGSNPFGVNSEEAYKSKLRVAQVILNRVESPYFPDTVHDVIFQKNAFTPLLDGRYYEVEIDPITVQACKDALLKSTADLTYGCEFFSSGTKTCLYGSYVYTDAVGHSFFKSYR